MAWAINLSKCVMCGTKLFWSSMHTMRHVGKESIRWKQTAKHGLMSSRQCWSLHPQRHSRIPGGPQGSAQRTETCHSLLLYIVYCIFILSDLQHTKSSLTSNIQEVPSNWSSWRMFQNAIQLELMKDVSQDPDKNIKSAQTMLKSEEKESAASSASGYHSHFFLPSNVWFWKKKPVATPAGIEWYCRESLVRMHKYLTIISLPSEKDWKHFTLSPIARKLLRSLCSLTPKVSGIKILSQHLLWVTLPS